MYCRSEDQLADLLTKPLKPHVFVKLQSLLRVCSSKEAEVILRKLSRLILKLIFVDISLREGVKRLVVQWII